jgi:hypothetical protein
LKVNNLEMIDMNLVTGIAGAHQSITSLSYLLVSNCDLKVRLSLNHTLFILHLNNISDGNSHVLYVTPCSTKVGDS